MASIANIIVTIIVPVVIFFSRSFPPVIAVVGAEWGNNNASVITHRIVINIPNVPYMIGVFKSFINNGEFNSPVDFFIGIGVDINYVATIIII